MIEASINRYLIQSQYNKLKLMKIVEKDFMGVKQFVKNTVTKGFNVKKMLDLDSLKGNAKVVSSLVSSFSGSSSVAGKVVKETFDAAVKRQQLTEADLQKRLHNARHVAKFCAIGALLVLLYTGYLFFTVSYLSGTVSLMVVLLLMSYAFRESFNGFQIEQRRLGCSVKEWFGSLFRGCRK